MIDFSKTLYTKSISLITFKRFIAWSVENFCFTSQFPCFVFPICDYVALPWHTFEGRTENEEKREKNGKRVYLSL